MVITALSVAIMLIAACMDNGRFYPALWSVGIEPRLFFGTVYFVAIALLLVDPVCAGLRTRSIR